MKKEATRLSRMNSVVAEELDEDYLSVTFSFQVFWYELVAHAFLPLSLPGVVWAEGFNGLRNKQLWGLREGRLFGIPGMICLGQYACAIAFWWMFIILLLYPNELSSSVDVFVASAFYMLRSALVACKAAYRSKAARVARRDSVISDGNRRGEELIPMWLNLNPKAIVRETDAAARKLRIPLHSTGVIAMCSVGDAKASLHDALALLPASSGGGGGGGGSNSPQQPMIVPVLGGSACVLPLRLMVLQIVAATSTHQKRSAQVRFEITRFFYAAIQAFTPLYMRGAASPSAPPLSLAGAMVQYTALFVSFMIAYNFFVPYYLAVMAEYGRRQRWLRALVALFDPHAAPRKQLLCPPGFHVNLCLRPNIVQVRTLWRWLRTVGFQFLVRVQLFITLVVITTLVLAAKLLVDAYYRSSLGPSVMLGLFNVAWCCFTIVVVLAHGIPANRILLSLRGLINRHQLEMRQRETQQSRVWAEEHSVHSKAASDIIGYDQAALPSQLLQAEGGGGEAALPLPGEVNREPFFSDTRVLRRRSALTASRWTFVSSPRNSSAGKNPTFISTSFREAPPVGSGSGGGGEGAQQQPPELHLVTAASPTAVVAAAAAARSSGGQIPMVELSPVPRVHQQLEAKDELPGGRSGNSSGSNGNSSGSSGSGSGSGKGVALSALSPELVNESSPPGATAQLLGSTRAPSVGNSTPLTGVGNNRSDHASSSSYLFALAPEEVRTTQQAMADVSAWAELEQQLNPMKLVGVPLGVWILRGAAVGIATWSVIVVRQLGLLEKFIQGAGP